MSEDARHGGGSVDPRVRAGRESAEEDGLGRPTRVIDEHYSTLLASNVALARRQPDDLEARLQHFEGDVVALHGLRLHGTHEDRSRGLGLGGHEVARVHAAEERLARRTRLVQESIPFGKAAGLGVGSRKPAD